PRLQQEGPADRPGRRDRLRCPPARRLPRRPGGVGSSAAAIRLAAAVLLLAIPVSAQEVFPGDAPSSQGGGTATETGAGSGTSPFFVRRIRNSDMRALFAGHSRRTSGTGEVTTKALSHAKGFHH